jgi:hypothetical protein
MKTAVGNRFSGYYFLGPSDLRKFFEQSGAKSITSGVELYFAEKFSSDSRFRAYFSLPLTDEKGSPLQIDPVRQSEEIEKRRQEFFRYYAVKAGAYFSKGSHDEWNIWQQLNKVRITDPTLGIGTQIPGYFEGLQIDPGAAEIPISVGYAMPQTTSTVVLPTAHLTPMVRILEEHSMVSENRLNGKQGENPSLQKPTQDVKKQA